MKRTILTVALAAILIGSVIVAHAATLNVNAGVLQTQTSAFTFETVELIVVVRRIAGGSGNQIGDDTEFTFSLVADRPYVVSANRPDVGCPDGTPEPHGLNSEPETGLAPGSLPQTHVVCFPQGGTTPIVSVTQPAGASS